MAQEIWSKPTHITKQCTLPQMFYMYQTPDAIGNSIIVVYQSHLQITELTADFAVCSTLKKNGT